jgi:hypothetical protein
MDHRPIGSVLAVSTDAKPRAKSVVTGAPYQSSAPANDEWRQAKRNNLADKLTVETKARVDLKVEKAATDRERRKVEAAPVFMLVVALLLDPAAVLLLLAAMRIGS